MFFAEFADEQDVKESGVSFVEDDIPADEKVVASTMDNWENPNQVTVFEVRD